MGAWDLAMDLGGGTLLGIVAARLGVAMIPLLRGRRTAEVTLTLALPYLVFVSGDHFLGVSGVVAVAVAGLVFGAGSRSRLSPSGWAYLDAVWEQVAFLAGSLVFILAALMVPKLLGTVSLHDGLLLLVLVAAALVARALVLFLLLPPLTLLKLSAKISNSYKLVSDLGRPARRRHPGAGLVGDGGARDRRRGPADRHGAGDRFRAVHPVRQRDDAASRHQAAGPEPAVAAQQGYPQSGIGAVVGGCPRTRYSRRRPSTSFRRP